MAKVKIGFKAFDPHELLCHFVAVDAGLYAGEGIEIELIDITFINDKELPEEIAQVSCGAALSAALKGSPQLIPFVGCDRPMFWIYAKKEITVIAELVDSRMATFPAIAPPHHLANIILGKHSINAQQQVRLSPARDDNARLGLLISGHTDAAVISSAIAPARIESAGLNKLCFFGDEIRIPTTGLAVHRKLYEKEPAMFQTLVNILRRSLAIIADDASTVAGMLEKYFGVSKADKVLTAELFQQCYTADGRTTEEIAQNAIQSLCRSFSISDIPDWREIYCNQ